MTSSRQAHILVESIRLGLPAQELRQSLHLVLAAALFENLVAIPTALGGVHGVGFKDGVEHVGGVDLRAVQILLAGFSRDGRESSRLEGDGKGGNT